MSDSRPNFSTALEHNLALTLELEGKGTPVKILSGNIERFHLNLHPYGHSCAIHFTAFGEDVDPLFTAPDIAKATLTFYALDPESRVNVGPPILVLKGIVTDKCFKIVPAEVDDEALRLYEITVCDAARATWEQHFPINAYVDLSMKDVIEKHTNPEISIKFDWAPLETKHPIIAFSLPHRDWLPETQQVSFYSFLCGWYFHQNNGIWSYDHKAHTYAILGKKSKPEGKPVVLYEWWVDPPVCLFPQPSRFNFKKMKPTFDSVENEEKDNPHSYKSVRRDSINAANYRCFPEQAPEETTSTLVPEKNIVEIELTQIDDKKFNLGQLLPGAGVTFDGDNGGKWCSDFNYKGKTFIVQSLYIQADKLTVPEKVSKPIQSYRMQVKMVLEDEEEPFVSRPAFIPPTYPFAMQGTIFSDIGDTEQSTYKILESDTAPQGQYLVQVPLVEDDKKVVVPFTPDYMSGQFYFPFTKGQRVELSFYLHTAKILRPSDWQALARLPAGIQGNQTVLAFDGKDKYMIIKHEFENGKDSVFTIMQSSSDSLTQIIQIKKQDIRISVDEKGKKSLSFEISKELGLVLTLDDSSAGVTQQTLFDGKAMTHTCKGSEGTSTIVQKPDAVTIDCKQFTVTADKIIMNAQDTISEKGANKVTLEGSVIHLASSSVKQGT